MQITPKNFESRSLDEWQLAFYDLYGDIDRDLPLYDIMLQIVADSTRIAEAMRRGSYDAALPYIPHVFSWLCSMTSKVARNQKDYHNLGGNKTLGELIWHKFPGVCAFCAEPKCKCPSIHVDAMTREERDEWMSGVAGKLEAARRSERPSRLDDWVEMFEHVYGTVNASRSSAEKTFHFLEEIGEVEVELRKADRKQQDLATRGKTQKIEWEDEVADVFSWLTAVYLHLRGVVHDLDRLVKAFETLGKAKDDQLVKRKQPAKGNQRVKLEPLLSFSHWVWREFGNKEGVGLRCHRCTEHPKCGCKMAKRR